MEKQVEKMDVINNDLIDLCTPVSTIASTIITTTSKNQISVVNDAVTAAVTSTTAASIQKSYVSRTLTSNSERYSILPAFPAASSRNNRPDLLLANVPSKYIRNILMHVCIL
jgi:hypothetical protein